MYTCSSYSFCLDDQYFHFAIATGQKETIDLVAVDAITIVVAGVAGASATVNLLLLSVGCQTSLGPRKGEC